MNALCSHRRDISLGMILRHSISLKELELSLYVMKPVLKLPGNLSKIYFMENVWNIIKKGIGNHLLCLKEEM